MTGREVRGDRDARSVNSPGDAPEDVVESGEDLIERGDVSDCTAHRSGTVLARRDRHAPFSRYRADGRFDADDAVEGCRASDRAVGTVPGEGIVPISSSQDSAGPMGRTVRDVAALYEVLTGLDHVLRLSL